VRMAQLRCDDGTLISLVLPELVKPLNPTD
jgi:hypothetical protein